MISVVLKCGGENRLEEGRGGIPRNLPGK